MSRRDYELIAAVIRNSEKDFTNPFHHALFASSMARSLAEQVGGNPRFNVSKFIRACIPTWVPGTTTEATWERFIR